MKTLLLNGKNLDAAYEILGDDAFLYGDNGGDSDGNGYLPSEQLENQKVVTAGFGEYVNALYLNDSEVLDLVPHCKELVELSDDWDAVRNSIGDLARTWAHFGGYGTMDSRWVIVR